MYVMYFVLSVDKMFVDEICVSVLYEFLVGMVCCMYVYVL